MEIKNSPPNIICGDTRKEYLIVKYLYGSRKKERKKNNVSGDNYLKRIANQPVNYFIFQNTTAGGVDVLNELKNSVILPIQNRRYKVSAKGNNDFLVCFKAYADSIRHRLSNSTYRGYLAEISKLRKFKCIITLKDFDKYFVREYENYMLTTLHNNYNTVNKTFRSIKAFLRQARFIGIIQHDPFWGYKMLHTPTTREALQWNEFNKLEQMKYRPLKENPRNVLNCFLFACYTGLRFIDVCRLKKEHIINGMIVIQMSKTGSVVRIPLSKRAASFVAERDGYLFRSYKNSKTNKYLQCLMELAGISRKVTFHVARHTFATMSLNMGISMEVLSGLLGHTNIKTTQLYAKILDETKVEMIKKWDEYDFT